MSDKPATPAIWTSGIVNVGIGIAIPAHGAHSESLLIRCRNINRFWQANLNIHKSRKASDFKIRVLDVGCQSQSDHTYC